MRRTKKKIKTAAAVLLMAAGSFLLMYCGTPMAEKVLSYHENRKYYKDLAEKMQKNGTEESADESGLAGKSVDFERLEDETARGDVIGWLYSPETPIDYPVVQTDDNDYYLSHRLNGKISSSGCIFADYRNESDFSDYNTIIYGHSMYDGSMFASLLEYESEEYYRKHPFLYLLTPQQNYRLNVLAVLKEENPEEEEPWQICFEEPMEAMAWILARRDESVIDTGLSVPLNSHTVTLSTCAYGSGQAKIIVVALLNKLPDSENRENICKNQQ